MEARESLGTRDLAGGVPREDEEPAAQDDRVAERDDTVRDDAVRDDTRGDAVRDDAAREGTGAVARGDAAGADAPQLFESDESSGYQSRWETIQTNFVDDPRRTVEEADELVAQVMRRLAESFAAERERLEAQWGRGEDVSTEDLRVALQRYRSFFQRLLAA